ncbi:uncharacterized protein [Amphiura filiformis]|uniref:uncharacterized protein n=1 Tax=Amphiura filiformis TaxID=82378 RepID=UPI003B21077C
MSSQISLKKLQLLVEDGQLIHPLIKSWNGGILTFFQGLSSQDGSTINAYRQANLYPDPYFILDDRTLAYPLLGAQEEMIPEDKIRWNERVRVVNQTADDCVTVVTENGTEFTGEYVILTNTVGVLQNGFVTFDPLLPPWKYEEFCRWQMGTVDTIFLKFDTKFWDDTEFILHASEIAGYYPAFLNLDAEGYHTGTNTLIGFVSGDEAYRIERMTDEDVQAEVVEVLKNMYGEDNVPEPTEFYMSRFITDEDHFGQFTTWPIGTLPRTARNASELT